MSVIVSIESEIRDINLVRSALNELSIQCGAEVFINENGCPRYYSGHGPLCDYVVKLPGRYDLGLKKKQDGTYELIADNELIGGRSGSDNFGRNDPGRKLLGENCGRLKQEYAVANAQKLARRKGQQLTRTNNQNGTIKLTVKTR